METLGLHHITAITSDAEKIYHFMTQILGLRLAKKTVNQDDIHTYHLFFTDAVASAGTDLTFFDFQGIQQRQLGSNSIQTIGLRVPSHEALKFFEKRFDALQVKHQEIRQLHDMKYLPFQDFDGQHYALFSDEGVPGIEGGIPWKHHEIPENYAIIGLGPIELRVNDIERMHEVMTVYMGFKKIFDTDDTFLYETSKGGNGARVIVIHDTSAPARQGFGGVHHVAFGVEDDKDLKAWINQLDNIPARHSGYVDRFYFHSLYTRLYPGILFEFATLGPGFVDDEESLETLGTTLALPPKLRPHRKQIESMIRPINTGNQS